MSRSAKRLGRGLNSLVSHLADQEPPAAVAETPASPTSSTGAPDKPSARQGSFACPVEQLQPNPFQPRNTISHESVLSLARSIEQNGLLQPILVRPKGDQFEIIAGERRWAAAKSLGLERVPVVLRQADDQQMLEFALIENIQREDLNAIDRAMAYRQFCARFDLKPEEVARRLGEDRTTVLNYLRLLELPDTIRAMVADEKISMGHARCLLGLADDPLREKLAQSVIQNQLSVRALEEIVRRQKTPLPTQKTEQTEAKALQAAHLRDIEQQFEHILKTKVVIREGRRKGTGRITIEYYSLDDFDRVASALGVTLT
jgi:ParB family chromosome partitioning protein